MESKAEFKSAHCSSSRPVSLVGKTPKPTTFCFSVENHPISLDKSELPLLSAGEKLLEFSICSAGRADLGSTHITHALPNSSSLPCLQQMLITSRHLWLPHKLLLCALGFKGDFLSNKPDTAAGKHTGRRRRWVSVWEHKGNYLLPVPLWFLRA